MTMSLLCEWIQYANIFLPRTCDDYVTFITIYLQNYLLYFLFLTFVFTYIKIYMYMYIYR